MKKTILITGGHLTPAISVIDEMVRRHPEWSLHFAGRTYAFTEKNGTTQESTEMEKRGIPFYPISAGRITQKLSLGTGINMLRIPVSIVEAFRIIRAVRPDCIVTFGGYVGLPIAIIGRILRVPVMLHEQTRVTGRANRIIRMLGAQMFTAFPGVLPGALYIGLPIRKEIFVPPSKISGDVPREPFLFISGGSTGAQSMNTALFPGIAKLLSDFSVVHQTGSVAFEEAKTFKMSLPSERQSRYVPVVSFSAADMAWLLHHARCFIGRSGANTVIETIVARLPSLFIPLPWASGDEQYWNARFVVDAGAGIVIRQTDVTPETIVSGVHAIESSEQTMRKKLDDLAQTIPIDAAGRMVDALEKMYKNS